MITYKITVKEQKDGQVTVEFQPKGKNPTEKEKKVGGAINRTLFNSIKSPPEPNKTEVPQNN